MSEPEYNKYSIFEQEAQDRNSILIGKYNKIPSYALWMDYDIKKESIQSRKEWWKNYESSKNNLYKNTALYWLNVLNSKN